LKYIITKIKSGRSYEDGHKDVDGQVVKLVQQMS